MKVQTSGACALQKYVHIIIIINYRHKSLWPLDHIQNVFAICDPVTLIKLILIGWRGLVMGYLCGKFGD